MGKKSKRRKQKQKAAKAANGWKPEVKAGKRVVISALVRVATCPKCQGTGLGIKPRQQPWNQDIDRSGNDRCEADACSLCKGRRVVSLNVCQGCGRPAPWSRNGIVYCGGKRCREVNLGVALPLEEMRRRFGPIRGFTVRDKRHGAAEAGRDWSEYMEQFGEGCFPMC